MVFWTAVIPDRDVKVNPLTGAAEMHVRNLPELDYYSPEGTGDLASLGPTWQRGFFDSTVSFDAVWSGPVSRRLAVRDKANGFEGVFNENQATVTWSAKSTSLGGFKFTSQPGNFSTSDPEVPGKNGVTSPLNFFAQVGTEANGVFFDGAVLQPASASRVAASVVSDGNSLPANRPWSEQLIRADGGTAYTAFPTDPQATPDQRHPPRRPPVTVHQPAAPHKMRHLSGEDALAAALAPVT